MPLLKRSLLILASLIAVFACFVTWFVLASDYGDHVYIGEYHLFNRLERSRLVLRPNHTFFQELIRDSSKQTAEGTWRSSGLGGIAFSKELLVVSGQDLAGDGTAYGDIKKAFGIIPMSIELGRYHILRYRRQDPSPSSPVAGTYVSDEEGSPSTLKMKADQTFEQSVVYDNRTARAKGTWSVNKDGDVVFSKDFLTSFARQLSGDESASVWNPQGSNLQIQISARSPLGAPVFRKSLYGW